MSWATDASEFTLTLVWSLESSAARATVSTGDGPSKYGVIQPYSDRVLGTWLAVYAAIADAMSPPGPAFAGLDFPGNSISAEGRITPTKILTLMPARDRIPSDTGCEKTVQMERQKRIKL